MSVELFVQSIHHPFYFISNEGRVFSRKRMRFLKTFPARKGFLQVSMDRRNVSVHIEMVESFIGQAVHQIWFTNGDKKDCKMSNLEWTLLNARPQTRMVMKYYTIEDNEIKPFKGE